MNTKTAKFLRFSKRTKESGQALVLIAFMLVILIGMLGLAIDGGGMFLLWRDAQNAVDTAALQAAFAYCTSNEDFDAAVETGLNAADDNGFDNNMVDNWVTIEPAPANRRPANVYVTDNNAIMLVTIRAVKPAYFIQLIYGGPLEVTVDTLAICSPAYDSIYEGYSMFAMGSNGLCGFPDTPNTGSTAQISPNGSRQHYFGPWFSNGNASVGGGGGDITFYDEGGIDYVGGTAGFDTKATNEDGSPITTNQTNEVTSFPLLYTIADFLPANVNYTSSAGVAMTTTQDGQYYSDAIATGGTTKYNRYPGNATLQGVLEGLYVVNGEATLKNATISSNGATIVATGQIKTTGSTNAQNNAFQPYVAGVTLFSTMNEGNPNCDVNNGTAPIVFSGNSIIGFGIVYAPYGGISMSGSDGAWCGALIGQAIDRSGSDTYIFGQTIPDVDRLIDLGVPTEFHQFAGRSCDYIDNDTPPYYGLGD